MRCLKMSTGEISNRYEFHKLINENDYADGAEIGVLNGEFTRYLLANTSMFMYAIDPWIAIPEYDDMHNSAPESVWELRMKNTYDNLSPFVGRYDIIKGYSVEVAKTFEEDSLDFIYIDADHRYEAVKADLEAWHDKIVVGGMMAGHDFVDSGENFGVKSAVMEFTKKYGYVWHLTSDEWASWWLYKKQVRK